MIQLKHSTRRRKEGKKGRPAPSYACDSGHKATSSVQTDKRKRNKD